MQYSGPYLENFRREHASADSGRARAVFEARQRSKSSHAARRARLRELERELTAPARVVGEPTAADISRLRERGERQRRRNRPPAIGAHEALHRAFK